MKLIISYLLLLFMNPLTIYTFSEKSNPNDWRIINDGVMGGISRAKFNIDEKGHGVFEGTISLANNGGFSSIRHQFDQLNIGANTKVSFLLKGDKKEYQFRIKDKKDSYYSYITTFKTTGEWEEIEISLKDFYPSYRGRKLPMSNFSGKTIEEIVFLIGNNKNETFKLMLDKIELR